MKAKTNSSPVRQLILAAMLILLAVTVVAHPPTGIVLDRAGNIYFSDLETIWKLDTSGKLSVFRPGVSGRHVHELAIDDQDNIYGADLSYESEKFISDIWIMSPQGTFKYLLQPTDKPPAGLSIWRDREGNNYLIDQNNHTKTQTLLLRRTRDGNVTTLAGGAYGYADGKGTAARFSSVGDMVFGPDRSLYLTDGGALRKVTLDGTVTTLAKDLAKRSKEDKPTLFGGTETILTGLAIDSNYNAYVADSGNRRLLKVSGDGKVEVLLRTYPPFSPNGVFLGPRGEIYVLEVGFTPPGSWSGPRVRKIDADGKSKILAMIGAETNGPNAMATIAPGAGSPDESLLSFLLIGDRSKYGMIIVGAAILLAGAFAWQRRKRQRA